MESIPDFERLLAVYGVCAQRFLFYKISNRHDAEDVIQETFAAAFQAFNTLEDNEKFKPWLLSIARHKLNDYYRQKSKSPVVFVDDIRGCFLPDANYDITEDIGEVIGRLTETDRQIISLYYICGYSQHEISLIIGIPAGTVKSRLHTAKQRFKTIYPYPVKSEGDNIMVRMPKTLPAFTVVGSDKPVHEILCEEFGSWRFFPSLDCKVMWGAYEAVSGRLSEEAHIEAIGKASVHGLEGIEFYSEQYIQGDKNKVMKRWFIYQRYENYARCLSETHYRFSPENKTKAYTDYKNNIPKLYSEGIKTQTTFLDENFKSCWQAGASSWGTDVRFKPGTNIVEESDTRYIITGDNERELTSCCILKINGKIFNAFKCVELLSNQNNTLVLIRYLNEEGRTLLDRQYQKNIRLRNHDLDKINAERDTITVNGETLYNTYNNIGNSIL